MPIVCGVNKIDSNITSMAIAEEACLNVLDPDNTTWFYQEPNSYSDFGGDLKTVARSPINPARQRKKGTITDLDASGGFNTDVTKSNLTRLLQGFFYADARQQPTTRPYNGNAIAITGVDDTTGYGAGGGLTIFSASDLILAEGFNTPVNNGLKLATAVSGTGIVATGLVDEASPPVGAKLTRVGRQFASGDIGLSFVAGLAQLTATAGDFTTMGLIPGQWVFIGGDVTADSFANNVGYARIGSVAAKSLVMDKTTFTPVTEVGTGKTIQLYFGTVIRSESDPALIKRRSYSIERQLGNDASGVQSEYLGGAVPNQLTLNIPQADKFNADLTFIAANNEQRTGLQGLKVGTRVASPGEDAFNTSSDVYRIRMDVQDAANPNPQALFGYVTDAKLTIDNNVTPAKAIGTLGAFDTTAGDFVVSGSVTSYFTTVAATQAVRNNADVGLYAILAAHNNGMIYDIPLLGLGGGRIAVEKDKPITVPLTTDGAQSKFGHTMLAEFFPYLPTVAMPKQV